MPPQKAQSPLCSQIKVLFYGTKSTLASIIGPFSRRAQIVDVNRGAKLQHNPEASID